MGRNIFGTSSISPLISHSLFLVQVINVKNIFFNFILNEEKNNIQRVPISQIYKIIKSVHFMEMCSFVGLNLKATRTWEFDDLRDKFLEVEKNLSFNVLFFYCLAIKFFHENISFTSGKFRSHMFWVFDQIFCLLRNISFLDFSLILNEKSWVKNVRVPKLCPTIYFLWNFKNFYYSFPTFSLIKIF